MDGAYLVSEAASSVVQEMLDTTVAAVSSCDTLERQAFGVVYHGLAPTTTSINQPVLPSSSENSEGSPWIELELHDLLVPPFGGDVEYGTDPVVRPRRSQPVTLLVRPIVLRPYGLLEGGLRVRVVRGPHLELDGVVGIRAVLEESTRDRQVGVTATFELVEPARYDVPEMGSMDLIVQERIGGSRI